MKKLLTILFLLVTISVFAPLGPHGPEGGGPPGPPPGPPCWPPPCVPVDGGILTFTFLAMLFGTKLLKKEK